MDIQGRRGATRSKFPGDILDFAVKAESVD